MDSSHADFIWPTHMGHKTTSADTTSDGSTMDTSDAAAATPSKRKSTKAQHAAGSAAAASTAVASSSTTAAALSSTHDSASIGVDDELIQQLHAFATRSPPNHASVNGSMEESGSKMAGALSLGLCCTIPKSKQYRSEEMIQ